jgi:hypothetical protein
MKLIKILALAFVFSSNANAGVEVSIGLSTSQTIYLACELEMNGKPTTVTLSSVKPQFSSGTLTMSFFENLGGLKYKFNRAHAALVTLDKSKKTMSIDADGVALAVETAGPGFERKATIKSSTGSSESIDCGITGNFSNLLK